MSAKDKYISALGEWFPVILKQRFKDIKVTVSENNNADDLMWNNISIRVDMSFPFGLRLITTEYELAPLSDQAIVDRAQHEARRTSNQLEEILGDLSGYKQRYLDLIKLRQGERGYYGK